MSIDITQFHTTFFEESFEGLNIMESGLLNLDIGDFDIEMVNAIFRAAHSIKGGSATLGFTQISSFTHVIETLLDQIRSGRRNITQELLDLLLRSIDCLRDIITATSNSTSYDEVVTKLLHDELALISGQNINFAHTHNDDSVVSTGTRNTWSIIFRPSDNLFVTGNDPILILKELSKLGEINIKANRDKLPEFNSINPEKCYLSWDIMLNTEASESNIREIFDWVIEDCELVISRQQAKAKISLDNKDQHVNKISTQKRNERASTQQSISANKSADSGSIRVNIDKIDDLINMVGELVITQSMIGKLDENIDEINNEKLERLRKSLTLFERNTRELQESVMRIRMLPISFSFNRFPRMIRDLCKILNKKATLHIKGEQTELDKTVMEKISDPLVHLIRNSIDHGIESPEIRIESGKDDTGNVTLNAYHKGGSIIIEISDDGAGIDKDIIVEKALKKGIINNIDISDDDAYELIFHPGFSTADIVSDVSGRGVGLDVVKRNIRELGGSIDVTSTINSGTMFKIRLPLTLAILDGQVLSVGGHRYILPLVSIIESIQVQHENINSINGNTEVYMVRNEYIPILRMHKVFNIKPNNTSLNDGLLVIVESDNTRIGLFIDDLLDQMQVVIKSLESNFKPVEAISGATILGDGTVSLILDIDGLINIYKKENASKSHIIAA